MPEGILCPRVSKVYGPSKKTALPRVVIFLAKRSQSDVESDTLVDFTVPERVAQMYERAEDKETSTETRVEAYVHA